MACRLGEMGIPSPSEVGQMLRELAPGLCEGFDTLTTFQEYVWGDKNLSKIRVHPRQEMFAKLWCEPPPRLIYGNVIQPPSFTLYIDPTIPEYEMHLVYKDGECKIITTN